MYITSEYRDVEPKCYEADHISKVEALLKKNFPGYFKSFLDSGTGGISMEQFAELQVHLGVRPDRQRKNNRSHTRETYKEIITDNYMNGRGEVFPVCDTFIDRDVKRTKIIRKEYTPSRSYSSSSSSRSTYHSHSTGSSGRSHTSSTRNF